MESQIVSDFTRQSEAYFKNRSEYDNVSAILLYWRDGDLEVGQELTALRTLFGSTLNFLVASYPIPSDGTQQAKLHAQIATLIEESALEKRSLVIIYYTGHCRESEGKAQWAAKREGGATLIWSDIQQRCFDATGDVLLILDCCHATIFSKGQKKEGRFEILAACAKGLETPMPGDGSFTWALLQALTEETVRNGIKVQKLQRLVEEHSRETPFWSSLGSDATTSITIKRLSLPPHPGFSKKPAGYLLFRASLLDDLDGLQIAEWLKANTPKNISAVQIEAIVLKARRIQKNLDHNALPSNSILRKLSQPAQLEILKELESLDTIMATSIRNAQSAHIRDDGDAISNTLHAIEDGVNAVSASIETPILLDLSRERMNQAASDEAVLPPDALETISLRNYVIAADKEDITSLEILRQNVSLSDTSDRFNRGRVHNKNVFFEFFEYVPNLDGDPYPETICQLESMTELLCHSKRFSFHILPCLGYIHDKVGRRFGLAFQVESKNSRANIQPLTLQFLYTARKRVSLSHRIKLSYALITALENFHRVGWVHKEIRSDNICFLASSQSIADSTENDTNPSVDFSSPWLFGFEYARAADAGTKLDEDHSHFRNLYRHPQRWSRPTVPFTRAHDIYSLGVMLLEVAYWKEVGQIAALKPGERVRPEAFREMLKRKLERDVPHQVGKVFTDTVIACFGFEAEVEGKSEFEMQRSFQKNILGRMKNIVDKV